MRILEREQFAKLFTTLGALLGRAKQIGDDIARLRLDIVAVLQEILTLLPKRET